MKKIILIGILVLIGGFTFGQTLKKGNLVGTHVLTIELNPGITMEQFQDFHLKTLIPEYEKHYKGWQLYLTKGIRGENKNKYGWIMVAESEKTRDKHYNDNGSLTEYGKVINAKMKPVLEEAEKFGKLNRTYTDWLIL